jgi:hypothetical protein
MTEDTKNTALIDLSTIEPSKVFVDGGTESLSKIVEAEVAKFSADVTTEEGRKEIFHFDRKIASTKIGIDTAKKLFTEGLREAVNAVNKEGKRFVDRMEEIQAEVSAPLKEWKEIERRRVEGLTDLLNEIKNLYDHGQAYKSTDITELLAKLDQINEGFDWEDFAQVAGEETEKMRDLLETKFAAAVEQEAKDAELEKLRKDAADRAAADEAARLVREGEENAKRETAEREKEVARQKVANEQNRVNLINANIKGMTLPEGCAGWSSARIDATIATLQATYTRGGLEEFTETARLTHDNSVKVLEGEKVIAKAREEAEENARTEAAAQRVRDQEAQRQKDKQAQEDKEAEDRKKDEENRAKIHKIVLDSMVAAVPDVDLKDVKKILRAIADGKVSLVSIKY